ncbi:MAG: hypothetical protein V4671_32665, partial [Armatimonadota bacterium]
MKSAKLVRSASLLVVADLILCSAGLAQPPPKTEVLSKPPAKTSGWRTSTTNNKIPENAFSSLLKIRKEPRPDGSLAVTVTNVSVSSLFFTGY